MPIDFSAFSTGFREQGRRDTQRRLDNVKAFNQFRQEFPTATAAEYQQMIDTLSDGGRNYLLGGLPRGAALDAIVSTANEKRQQEAANRAQDQFKRTVELRGTLQGAAAGIMLNYRDPDEGGYTAVDYDNMTQQLAERFPNTNLSDLNLDARSLFSPKLRQTAILEETNKWLPTVKSFIDATGGEITPEALRRLGAPEALVNPLIERTQKLERERVEQKQRESRADMLRIAEEAIRDGKNPYERIVFYYEKDAPDPNSPFMKQLQAEAQRNHDNAENERARETKKRMFDLQTSAVADDALKASAALGSDEDFYKLLASLVDRTLTDRDAQEVFGVSLQEIIANPHRYLSELKDAIDYQLSGNQRAFAAKEEQKIASGASARRKTLTESSIEAVTRRFGDESNQKAPPQAGHAGRSGQLVAQRLARDIHMSPTVLDRLEALYHSDEMKALREDKGEPLLTHEVMNFIEQDSVFQGLAEQSNLANVAADREKMYRANQASLPITDFDEYLRSNRTEIDSDRQNREDDINRVMRKHADKPKLLVQYLETALRLAEKEHSDRVALWQAQSQAQTTAYGGVGWVDIKGPQYDPKVIFGDGESLEGLSRVAIQSVIDNIRERLKGLNKQVGRESTTSPISVSAPPPSVQTPLDTAETYTQAYIPLRNRLAAETSPATKAFEWVYEELGPRRFGAEPDVVPEKTVAEAALHFLELPDVVNAVRKSPKLLDQLEADRARFLLYSDHPAVTRWRQSVDGQKHVEKIQAEMIRDPN